MSGKVVRLPRKLKKYKKKILSSYQHGPIDSLMPFEFRLYESEIEK